MRESHRCPMCGYPSLSKRGVDIHTIRSHGMNEQAERNYAIFHMVMVDGMAPSTVAEALEISTGTVYRVVQRGLSYPGVYELLRD